MTWSGRDDSDAIRVTPRTRGVSSSGWIVSAGGLHRGPGRAGVVSHRGERHPHAAPRPPRRPGCAEHVLETARYSCRRTTRGLLRSARQRALRASGRLGALDDAALPGGAGRSTAGSRTPGSPSVWAFMGDDAGDGLLSVAPDRREESYHGGPRPQLRAVQAG